MRNGLHMNLASPPYLEALEDGRLTLPFCTACNRWFSPWIFLCPDDYEHKVEFRDVAPRGTIVSWVVYRRQYDLARELAVPYTVGQIALEHGVRIHALQAERADPALRRGGAVELSVVLDDGPAYITFHTVAEAHEEGV
jgi:uncharacterized OB-fold protein